MSFVTSIVVAGALAGGVHMDADAQGQPVLGWTRWTRHARVTEVADVRGGRLVGRPHRLAPATASLNDLDVARSGAAIACWSESRSRRSNRTQLRVAKRAPGGRWSRGRVVARLRTYADDLSCGVSDTGATVLVWTEGRAHAIRAVAVAADGTVGRTARLTRGLAWPTEVEVAADGSAAVGYTRPDDIVRLAHRSAAGTWSQRAFGPERGVPPELALTPAGQPVLAWRSYSGVLRMVVGPTYAPVELSAARDVGLGAFVAGPRGDLLALTTTGASLPTSPVPVDGRRTPSALGASIARPGAPFAPTTPLGPVSESPLEAALAADGSGVVGWYGGSTVGARKLTADGTWLPAVELTTTVHGELFLAAAPDGTATAAWNELTGDGNEEVLRLAVL